MIDGRTHTELMTIRDTMREALSNAMDERDQRPGLVSDGPRNVPAWVHYEREAMTTAVNTARANRGLEPITLKAVARVEQQAVGHVDYFQKFAFYCAELAIGIGSTNPSV
ncbi:hypothetical protein N2384_01625 [Bacillus paralicheniformis]|uniref:hypothetical protein n=1 Tax=Bacillus paralicheniformis TaxID=1648923 RepID=UPI0021A814A3|nr:hypothetical protein [Bacillus paralicheniformis]UWS61956.1 hypothetical protein N2384_01625 [Bacillus paralicheniformis]